MLKRFLTVKRIYDLMSTFSGIVKGEHGVTSSIDRMLYI